MSRRSEEWNQRSAASCALRITLIYVVFGGLWILCTDWLLAWLIGDRTNSQTLTWLQVWKGWLFVAVTAAILYVLVRQGVGVLEQATRSLDQAKRSAEDANQAKDRFLAILSHELRTPMTPVLAAVSELAEDTGLNKALRDDLIMVRRNVELQTQLIDDLLDVSRIISGKLALRPREVDAHEILSQAVRICEGGARAKGLAVDLRLDAKHYCVLADGARLLQVFLNLVSNSVKFTPSGGRIEIRSTNRPAMVRASEDGAAGPSLNGQVRLVVEVADTGIGIKPEVLPRIFNAYQQGEAATTQQFGGLGLGLAISRMIIEQHGGKICASSAGPGQGATFTVELGTVEPSEPPCQAAQPAPGDARAQNILLVEDDVDTGKTLGRLLEMRGHRVRLAGGFRAAVAAAREEAFDVLVADIGLPDGNGLDLLHTIRQFRELPGIAMSGYGMDADIERSLAAGYAEHVTKPINIRQLEEAIARVAATAQRA